MMEESCIREFFYFFVVFIVLFLLLLFPFFVLYISNRVNSRQNSLCKIALYSVFLIDSLSSLFLLLYVFSFYLCLFSFSLSFSSIYIFLLSPLHSFNDGYSVYPILSEILDLKIVKIKNI